MPALSFDATKAAAFGFGSAAAFMAAFPPGHARPRGARD